MNKNAGCDYYATELRGKLRKVLQLRLRRENILACLRQGVWKNGFLQLSLR